MLPAVCVADGAGAETGAGLDIRAIAAAPASAAPARARDISIARARGEYGLSGCCISERFAAEGGVSGVSGGPAGWRGTFGAFAWNKTSSLPLTKTLSLGCFECRLGCRALTAVPGLEAGGDGGGDHAPLVRFSKYFPTAMSCDRESIAGPNVSSAVSKRSRSPRASATFWSRRRCHCSKSVTDRFMRRADRVIRGLCELAVSS